MEAFYDTAVILDNASQERKFREKFKKIGGESIPAPEFPAYAMIMKTNFGLFAIPNKLSDADFGLRAYNKSAISIKQFEKMIEEIGNEKI